MVMTDTHRIVIAFGDGRTLTEDHASPAGLFRSLLTCPERIQAILCSTITSAELEHLLPLLSRPMPLLEALVIVIWHPTNPGFACLNAPTIDLPKARFPRLHKLRLEGMAVNMTVPFLPSLRDLTMRNYPGVERCLPICDFVAAVASCPALEVLRISRYSSIMQRIAEPSWQPPMLRSLKLLAISDTPSGMSFLLQFLHIPATANIHLKIDAAGLYDDFGCTVAAALPHDRRTLPILKEVTALDVSVQENTYQLASTAPRGHQLRIDIDMDVEITFGLLQRDTLFESIIRNIGLVFSESPITRASFQGDLTRTTAEAWRAAFSALPRLDFLTIHDCGRHSTGALSLVNALANPAEPADPTPTVLPVACMKLTKLGMSGPSLGLLLLEGLATCLERRRAAGADPSKLTLYVRMGTEVWHGGAEQLIKDGVARLRRLCGSVELQ